MKSINRNFAGMLVLGIMLGMSSPSFAQTDSFNQGMTESREQVMTTDRVDTNRAENDNGSWGWLGLLGLLGLIGLRGMKRDERSYRSEVGRAARDTSGPTGTHGGAGSTRIDPGQQPGSMGPQVGGSRV